MEQESQGQDPTSKKSEEIMEASKQQKEPVNPNEQRQQTGIVAPVAPERETPPEVALETKKAENMGNEANPTPGHQCSEPGDEADAELTTMLKQIETSFPRQARPHDLEAISFSLRHLFNRVDFLYCQALPDLEQWTTRSDAPRTVLNQQIWLHLQTVNRTLDRMAPLCHLLSDVIECLLDTLDNEEVWLRTFEEEETLLLQQVQKPKAPPIPRLTRAIPEPVTNDGEIWERAVKILMDRLLIWQEQHHKLPSFLQQFAQPTLATSSLNELDAAFAVLLESAGAIFGDILPHFRLIEPEDKEEISALLFDLMQQSDQMLVQFEVTLEPLTSLLRHFASTSESS